MNTTKRQIELIFDDGSKGIRTAEPSTLDEIIKHFKSEVMNGDYFGSKPYDDRLRYIAKLEQLKEKGEL